MHVPTSLTALTLAAALATAPSARAQSLDAHASLAPTVDGARAAFHLPATPAPGTAAAAAPRFSSSERYMIVGGAVLVVGALVRGDAGAIIMIGGGAVLVYGLYLYLDQGSTGTRVGMSKTF